MINKKLTLSIVIPVYNEENYLKNCLDSIVSQVSQPDEVIVVDNNSTDASVEIAKSYPFVTILRESQQHQSFAQKTGFNAAKGDIIGRIDADSVLPIDWVQRVKDEFLSDRSLVGLTGSTVPYDVQSKKASVSIFRFYINYASKLAETRMLWGANCAFRRTAWLEVRDKVLQRPDIWEDFDLSFCLAGQGKIKCISDLVVPTSFRSAHKSLISQTRYQYRAVRTFRIRTGHVKATMLMLVWLTMYGLYPATLIDRYIFKSVSKLKNRVWSGQFSYRPDEL
jgi:glycosyltransferase involved in cell wall biosynthesis